MTEKHRVFQPDWPLPPGVHAFVTTRNGGVSRGDWHSFNLGLHVGDDPLAVAANRQLLVEEITLRSGWTPDIQWIQQVHGTSVFRAGSKPASTLPQADALFTSSPGIALGILTADCLPVLFCSDDGSEIAIAHAGWRGLLGGVLENTLHDFRQAPAAIRTWLGPAIGPCHFEVGEEVRRAFLTQASADAVSATEEAFRLSDLPGKYFADLYQLARIRLRRQGVRHISGDVRCTSCDHDEFYSYRVSRQTGRFATLVFKSP